MAEAGSASSSPNRMWLTPPTSTITQGTSSRCRPALSADRVGVDRADPSRPRADSCPPKGCVWRHAGGLLPGGEGPRAQPVEAYLHGST
jgi:hypothetical protein